MKHLMPIASCLVFLFISHTPGFCDWRDIRNGDVIPTKSYADQPYIIQTDDGAWLCIVTTGAGHEGQPGQHVTTMRSTDFGKTWSEPIALEPPDGPEASYAVMLKAPSGRIFAFYNHNTDNLREVKTINGGEISRVDSLGYFVFKYSDDHGRSWSDQRYTIPVREMEIDRENVYQGDIRFFWNVGKPFIHKNAAYVSLHKVGGFGEGFFTRNEGVLLKSDNLLTVESLIDARWETLPDGEIGLRTPAGGGPISAEQSYAKLSDGSLYCVYRTIDGHPVFTYSRDDGRTWDKPQYKRFSDGRLMKHPRAANFVWKSSNGKYLYWFHNHGGRSYEDRNPAWLCAGEEIDSPDGKIIHWSQPEILLYDDDPYIRMSYPDFVEEDGRYFFTETQKNVARVHEVPKEFLETLWGQFDNHSRIRDDIIAEWDVSSPTTSLMLPALPLFVARDFSRPDYGTTDLRNGFTIDLWITFETLDPGQVVFDSRDDEGKGVVLVTSQDQTLELILNDGRTQNQWRCDRGKIQPDTLHHIGIIVDGGPKIISFIIDGTFNDGGEDRQFGWGRFSPNLRHANGSNTLRITPDTPAQIKSLRIYNRALMVSEVIGTYRAGIKE